MDALKETGQLLVEQSDVATPEDLGDKVTTGTKDMERDVEGLEGGKTE